MALQADIVAVIDGQVRRVQLSVTQVVLRDSEGNPVLVAGEYGGDNTSVISRIGDDDFIRILNAFGVRTREDELRVDLLDPSKL